MNSAGGALINVQPAISPEPPLELQRLVNEATWCVYPLAFRRQDVQGFVKQLTRTNRTIITLFQSPALIAAEWSQSP